MALTDTRIRKLKAGAKLYRESDGDRLYIAVMPSGTKAWHYRYRRPVTKKANTISMGEYPALGLADARQKRDDFNKLLVQGIDPDGHRRAAQAAAQAAHDNTFRAVAGRWLDEQTFGDKTRQKAEWMFGSHVFPEIGDLPIGDIKYRHLRDALLAIQAKGGADSGHSMGHTARRARSRIREVFAYAVAHEIIENDPSSALKNNVLAPVQVKHRAAITDPKAVPGLLSKLDSYGKRKGTFVTAQALRLLPLVFVRPGELCGAEWSEFDLDAALWRIPAERMKMKTEHLVPLSRQAVATLRELSEVTGTFKLVFAGRNDPRRPLSENTINQAMRRLGIGKEEMCGHGFRSMASTLLNEMGWRSDVIERQLAHVEQNTVRATVPSTWPSVPR